MAVETGKKNLMDVVYNLYSLTTEKKSSVCEVLASFGA